MHPNREVRKWIYGIALTVIPLLVAYGIVDESTAALWAALVGAVVAPGLALFNLTPTDDVTHNHEPQLDENP
jgi:hypothetical protein